MDCEDPYLCTPIFYASKAGILENIILLKKFGAHVNHKDEEDRTALFRARTYETVMLLLKYGADPTISASRYSKDDEVIPVTAIEHAIDFNVDSVNAILDNCLMKDPDENLVMDFGVFKSHQGESSILESVSQLHYDKNDDKPPLLLHPLLQIFLNLKFKRVLVMLLLQIMFQVMQLLPFTAMAVHYVQMTTCTDTECRDPFGINV